MPDLTEAKEASWNEAVERAEVLIALTAFDIPTARFIHDLAFNNGASFGMDIADATLKAVEKIGERLSDVS